mmetsp:Transcript_34133/g.91077  ORF Transcript_34133/g.91077 Transcript_34133/m.91077 type:complete len:151 (+) Transcript_34133:606-1058(+)
MRPLIARCGRGQRREIAEQPVRAGPPASQRLASDFAVEEVFVSEVSAALLLARCWVRESRRGSRLERGLELRCAQGARDRQQCLQQVFGLLPPPAPSSGQARGLQALASAQLETATEAVFDPPSVEYVSVAWARPDPSSPRWEDSMWFLW